MALVTQTITPTSTFTPFEGMSEAQRLTNAVPRGLVRFETRVATAVKPVNDDLLLEITGSLPPNFAYVVSTLSYVIQIDTAADFDNFARLRIFNGLPNAVPGNEQIALFNFSKLLSGVGTAERVLTYGEGSLREWFPNPIWRTAGAAGISFTLRITNGNNAVMAAGTQFFNMSFYQYDLTQAVRFPLNSPIPVGIR